MIGRVMAPFGIKGEVRVRPETDYPQRLAEVDTVCLELPGGREEMARPARVRLTPKGALVRFEGCRDRNDAERLRGAWVKIRPSMVPPLPEGEFYVHQILGLRAVTADGREIGEVTEVIRTGANDVYVAGGKMIPAVRKFIREISLEEGVMVVDLPPEEEAG